MSDDNPDDYEYDVRFNNDKTVRMSREEMDLTLRGGRPVFSVTKVKKKRVVDG